MEVDNFRLASYAFGSDRVTFTRRGAGWLKSPFVSGNCWEVFIVYDCVFTACERNAFHDCLPAYVLLLLDGRSRTFRGRLICGLFPEGASRQTPPLGSGRVAVLDLIPQMVFL